MSEEPLRMNADQVAARAIHYLRYKRQCGLIWTQRSPWNRSDHHPDVIGITKDRRVIEVEVKVSMADFRANAEKSCMNSVSRLVYRQPEFAGPVWEHAAAFYFAVPLKLASPAAAELPSYAGLLVVHENPWQTFVLRAAPRRPNAPRLSTREMVLAAKHLSAMLATLSMSRGGVAA